MDGDASRPTPKILNWRSFVALALGVILLVAANSDAIFSSAATHVAEQKGLFRLLIQEIGFALIVALVIWAMWEYFSQAESEDQWNARIERVAKSVFFGVFKRNFPEQLIQEANLLLLEQSFVRTGCQLLYTLRDDTFQREDGQQVSFVRLEAIARFKIKNIGNGNVTCPIATALPNAVHPGMKEKCQVRRVQVRTDGGEWETLPLDEAEKKFRAQLADDRNHQARFELPSRNTIPGQEIEIVWDYVMAKEEEDSEVMLSLFPTDSVVITIVDQGTSKRIVRAKSIHRTQLENISSEHPQGTYCYRLDRYLLPRQGFVMWWKKDYSPGNALGGGALTAPSTPPGPEPVKAVI